MNSRKNCTDLLEIIRNREKAHIDSRDHHKRMDQIFKVATLMSSTAVTYLVSSQDDEDITGDSDSDTYTYERFMTFTTTIFSGLCTLLNNASKAEIHGIVAKKYGLLGNKLEVLIRNNTCTDEVYVEKSEEYSSILENAPNIGPIVARKYKIRKTRVKEIRKMNNQDSIPGDQEL